jgi:hypothetical protein
MLTLDPEMKRFIIRTHALYSTTSQILDIIHACLLNDESLFYWQSHEMAALRYYWYMAS